MNEHEEAEGRMRSVFVDTILGHADRFVGKGFELPFVFVAIGADGQQSRGTVSRANSGTLELEITEPAPRLSFPVLVTLSNDEFNAPFRIVIDGGT